MFTYIFLQSHVFCAGLAHHLKLGMLLKETLHWSTTCPIRLFSVDQNADSRGWNGRNQTASDHFYLVWWQGPQAHLFNLSPLKLSITSTPFLWPSLFPRWPLHLIFILCDQHQLKFHSNFIHTVKFKNLLYYL